MTDSPEQTSSSTPPPAEPVPATAPEGKAATPPAPARAPAPRPKTPAAPAYEPPEARRDFFSDATREMLAPFAGILERKINPLLAALESIPNEVERFTRKSMPGTRDQPQGGSGAYSLPQKAAPPPERFLRPPGAMEPGEFETVCSRCGKCVEVCPAQAIRLDTRGMTAEGLPYIVAGEQPCVVCDSLACMHSCPTGALKVVDRLRIKLGTAKVNQDLCLRDRGEDCRLCVEACPITGSGASPAGEAILIHADSGRIRVRKNICVGCGLCENHCPTDPRAIQVNPYRGIVDPIIA